MSEGKALRLDDQLCFALYAATNAVTRAYRPHLKEIGLTYPQYLVMMALWQDGELPTHHVAERLALPANALTPLVDRLEKSGLVSRRRDARDRRVVHVALTPEGRALEEGASLAQQAVECRTHMAPEDVGRLRDELKTLVRQLEPETVNAQGDRAKAD